MIEVQVIINQNKIRSRIIDIKEFSSDGKVQSLYFFEAHSSAKLNISEVCRLQREFHGCGLCHEIIADTISEKAVAGGYVTRWQSEFSDS